MQADNMVFDSTTVRNHTLAFEWISPEIKKEVRHQWLAKLLGSIAADSSVQVHIKRDYTATPLHCQNFCKSTLYKAMRLAICFFEPFLQRWFWQQNTHLIEKLKFSKAPEIKPESSTKPSPSQSPDSTLTQVFEDLSDERYEELQDRAEFGGHFCFSIEELKEFNLAELDAIIGGFNLNLPEDWSENEEQCMKLALLLKAVLPALQSKKSPFGVALKRKIKNWLRQWTQAILPESALGILSQKEVGTLK